MFTYRAIVRNIHLLGITPDLTKLKSLIIENCIGLDDSPPSKRKYSFSDMELILSAKDKYSL